MAGILIRLATNEGPLNIKMAGATETYNVTVPAIAKRPSALCPYGTINEMICAEIGRFLKLPIPPYCITREQGEYWFATLNASLTGQPLPPGDFDYLCEKKPFEATGMLLFDIYVMNPDRHSKNFYLAILGRHAGKLLLFDHGHALLGIAEGRGAERLRKGEKLLGCDSYYTAPGGQIHDVFVKLSTDDFIEEWVSRIASIPDYFIDATVDEAKGYGLEKSDAAETARVLKSRRSNMLTILTENRNHFQNLKPTIFAPVTGLGL